MAEMTGGCQCGKVRYTAQVAEAEAYLCHCRMCQRATGGYAASFVHVPQEAVRWDSEPDWYASSPIAQRLSLQPLLHVPQRFLDGFHAARLQQLLGADAEGADRRGIHQDGRTHFLRVPFLIG